MSYWSYHLLYSGSNLSSPPWVLPCDPLWGAGLEHTEAGAHLKLDLEWFLGHKTEAMRDV